MKALNISELDTIVAVLQQLQGAYLQDILVSNRDVALYFYSPERSGWMVIDLNPQAPGAWLIEKIPFGIKKQQTPVQLFLKSHFVGRKLVNLKRDQKLGRVLFLTFSGDGDASLEIRLLPHGQNIILSASGKSLSLKKPQSLEPMTEQHRLSATDDTGYEKLLNVWLLHRSKGFKKTEAPAAQAHREKAIKKIQKSLRKVEDVLQELQNQNWKAVGDFLVKTQSVVEAMKSFSEYIHSEQSLAQNIENCFSQHKKNQLKIDGAQKRIFDIQKQLAFLEKQTDEEFLKNHPQKRQAVKVKTPQGVSAKTRKLQVSEDLTFLVGKSATDNLALLRKAHAWDCWFHLKDFPSAHGILFRNKKRKLTGKEVENAARFLVTVSAEKNKKLMPGELISVIWAEVRHVSPIKGDKLGRVSYKNAQNLIVKF